MSTSSLKKWLAKILEKASAADKQPRIAVLGIGNEFNGDDFAGVLTARLLIKKLETLKTAYLNSAPPTTGMYSTDRLFVLDAGLAPENFTGVLRKYEPDIILLIDAAQMDEKGGAILLVESTEVSGFSASTHLQPLSTLANYLRDELGCQVYIIGIQPEYLEFDRPISPKVRAACRRLAAGLAELY